MLDYVYLSEAVEILVVAARGPSLKGIPMR